MSTATLSNVLTAARKIHLAWIKWNEQDGPMTPFNRAMIKGMSAELHHTVMDATVDDFAAQIARVHGLAEPEVLEMAELR